MPISMPIVHKIMQMMHNECYYMNPIIMLTIMPISAYCYAHYDGHYYAYYACL